MMKDPTYRWIAWIFEAFLWGGELVGDENLLEGPAVFVSNHLGAVGPIAVLACLPVRVYPWVISDMLDNDKSAAYLNQDFVERQLHLAPPFSLSVAKAISKISVRLLRSAGCVPVWQGEKLHELGELYYERTGKSLRFYPVAVHLDSYCVKIGRPIAYNSKNHPANERLRIKNVLESSIREMYLDMGMKGFPGIPIQH
jgi:hypothetical protein